MHELFNGIKQGIDFAVTMHPQSDIGTTLVYTPGFANFVVIVVLIGLGRLVYKGLERTILGRNSPFGPIGLAVVVSLLAFAWSGIATVCLASFYFVGSFAGLLIGAQNGRRLRQSPIFGIGIIIGIIIVGVSNLLIPPSVSSIIQIGLVGWLTWDATSENMTLLRLPEFPSFSMLLAIGGTISLSVFQPEAFHKLLIEASRTTALETNGNLTITKVLSYSPIAGWIAGVLELWPSKY